LLKLFLPFIEVCSTIDQFIGGISPLLQLNICFS
jgi:hypothetical protein